MATLFFSYSHHDEGIRDELEIHPSMLKRQGLIEAWHDRRIGAGNNELLSQEGAAEYLWSILIERLQ